MPFPPGCQPSNLLTFVTLLVQYGPTIHHLNSALSKVVDLYKSSLALEFLGTDSPYLFAQSTTHSRGVSSQQWTDQHKKAFHKFTGLSPCPKTMRQSFICHLRSDKDVDQELKDSAAKAMSELSHATFYYSVLTCCLLLLHRAPCFYTRKRQVRRHVSISGPLGGCLVAPALFSSCC